MDEMGRRDEAFAEALYQQARKQAAGIPIHANNYIAYARSGRYRTNAVRPAFLMQAFGMTDEEYEALRAMIYG